MKAMSLQSAVQFESGALTVEPVIRPYLGRPECLEPLPAIPFTTGVATPLR
jgi:hypothetical protein